MNQEMEEVPDENVHYLNFGGDTWLNILVRNSSNCTPTEWILLFVIFIRTQ